MKGELGMFLRLSFLWTWASTGVKVFFFFGGIV